jgi:TB2/DP1, HVA22 family
VRNVSVWLAPQVYWLTLAIFTGAERLLDMFVFWCVPQCISMRLKVAAKRKHDMHTKVHVWTSCRMPLYYEAKLLFVVWLWHPRSKGAVYLYQHSLQPLLLAHEQTIDRKIEEFKAMGGDFVAGNFSKCAAFSTFDQACE